VKKQLHTHKQLHCSDVRQARCVFSLEHTGRGASHAIPGCTQHHTVAGRGHAPGAVHGHTSSFGAESPPPLPTSLRLGARGLGRTRRGFVWPRTARALALHTRTAPPWRCLSRVNTRLSKVNKRLSTVNKRLSTVNKRLSTVNKRLSTVNKRLSTVNKRLSTVNKRLSTVNKRLSTVNKRLSTVNKRLSTVNKRLVPFMSVFFSSVQLGTGAIAPPGALSDTPAPQPHGS
jgi:chaperonin cofactor prefoldin